MRCGMTRATAVGAWWRLSTLTAMVLFTVGACIPAMPARSPAATPSSSPAASPKSSNAIALLPCQDVIGSLAAPFSSYSIVFDRVALPTGQVLGAYPSGESDPTARLFAKTGLLIRRGTSFDLVVSDDWRGRLTVGWGSPGKRTSHLRVPGCRPTKTLNPIRESDEWLAYAGGYWVSQPACVSLVVRSDQAEQTVQVGVGASCPGQSPPPAK